MSGEAPVVETSLLSTAVWMLSSDLTYSQVPGYKPHHEGPSKMPLMENYRTRDGRLIQMMLLDPRPHWPSFCRLVELDRLIDDPLFVDNKARMQKCDRAFRADRREDQRPGTGRRGSRCSMPGMRRGNSSRRSRRSRRIPRSMPTR